VAFLRNKKMKKLILLYILFLCCCQKLQPKKYIVQISTNGVITTIDSIRAFDDTNAYFQGVKWWFANKKTEQILNSTEKADAFVVLDEAGIDLKTKLSKKVTDSCEKIWIGVVRQQLY
jgi:hypothetical protein